MVQLKNMSKHPRTEVSFAPTKVFVEKYGHAEGERQRLAYERPTWAREPIKPVPTCEISHESPLRESTPPDVLLFGTSFAMGVMTGAFIMWLLYQ